MHDKTEERKFPKYITALNINLSFPNSVITCAPFSITTHTSHLSLTKEAGAEGSSVYHLGRIFLTGYKVPESPRQVQFHRAGRCRPQKCTGVIGKGPR